MKKTLAFLGLGVMGTPMARNLRKAGYPFVVYNRLHAKGSHCSKISRIGRRLVRRACTARTYR